MPDDGIEKREGEARRFDERRASLFVGNNRQTILVRFGAAVRTQRHALGLTQADLAQRTGLSRSSISEIECGRENISLERADRVAQALHCSLADLIQSSTND